jgi:hypothetical protein
MHLYAIDPLENGMTANVYSNMPMRMDLVALILQMMNMMKKAG